MAELSSKALQLTARCISSLLGSEHGWEWKKVVSDLDFSWHSVDQLLVGIKCIAQSFYYVFLSLFLSINIYFIDCNKCYINIHGNSCIPLLVL